MKIKEKKIHFLAWVVTASLAWADPTTGWRQTAAGSYDYNDSANWVGGEINGVFGADLTLDGAQTITFAADTTLADGLSFSHTGAAITFTAADAAVPHSLTLGDAIVNGSAETVTFADSLAIDLGGDSRDMDAAAGDIIIQGVISNGGLVYRGANALKLDGANTFAGGLDIFASGALVPRNNHALGTGTVTFEGGNKLLNESLNPLKIETNNPYMFKGNVWITGNQESNRSVDFGSGEITITQPFSMTLGGGEPNRGKDKGTYTFRGQIAVDSPYQIDAITMNPHNDVNDVQSKFVTYANLVLSGESSLINTGHPSNSAWQFYGVVSGNGTLKTTGRIDFYTANTFTGTLSIESGTLYAVKKGGTGNARILIKEGATFQQGANSGMGYSLDALLSAGMIDPASAGCIALQYNNSGTIDLHDYPLLSIGSANEKSASLSGTISAPETGIIRLGGGGQILKVASVIPAGCDLAVSGNSIQFTTDQPDFNGTVTLSSGLKLILSTGVSLPQATLIANRSGTIQFGMANGGDALRAKEVVLVAGTLQLDGSAAASAVHRVGTVRLLPDEAGDSSQFKMAGGTADSPIAFHIGALARADRKPVMLNLDATALGVSEKVFVGSGLVHPAASTIIPWIRNNGRLVKEVSGELQRLGANEVTSDADAAVAGGNVLLTGNESLTVSAENGSIGSISMIYADSKDPSFTATAGTYNLLSAALDLSAYKSTTCSANLDFGTKTGYVSVRISGQKSATAKLSGSISGTGGLVFSSCQDTAENKPFEVYCSGSDYSGDTYILGRLDPHHADFFPHGEARPGDLYVYGILSLNSVSPLEINGLNGRGTITRRNGTCRMSVGCDGSDGNFEGTFINSTNTDFGMTKEGVGRQRFNCVMAFKLSATVNGGTLQIDGSLATGNSTSDITVNSGATLSGCGTISAARSNHICANGTLAPGSEEIPNRAMTMTSTLKMDDGSKMRFHVGKDRWTQLVCEAPVTGAGSTVAVTVTGEGKGEWKLLEAPSLEPVFVKAEGVTGRLYVVAATESESGNEELWYKRMAGLAVLVR